MATALAEVQWDAMLKEMYPDGVPLEIMQRKHLLLSKLKKEGDAYGEYLVIPVIVDGPAGRSAGIGTVLSDTGPISPTVTRKFAVTLAKDYAATWIDELTIRKASSDRGSFVNARKFEVDALLRELGNSLSHALYRAGDGTVGRGDGAWTITGNVITLLTRADTKFFGLGMILDAIANSSGVPGAARSPAAAGVRAKVTAIDEDAGTVTCALNSNGVAVTDLSAVYTSLANTDWFAPVGDYNDSWATTSAQKIRGLAAWIPLAAPGGGDSFYGVNRSEFPSRLAGNRLNDSTAPAEDSIMALAEVMHERGAYPDFVVLSPRQFTKISKRKQATVELDTSGGTANHGFMRFFIATSAGMLPVYADPDCPEDRGYILTLETWAIKHLGLPEVVSTDGLSALRRSATDQIEIRCRYYAQLVCYAPGLNGVFAVS